MKTSIYLALVFFVNLIFANQAEMNGIRLDDYGDYPKEWKLITVRYRKDSNEMRFTYANPIAANAMEKAQLPYPEGSVFAKISFISGIDPAFESSLVPSGTRRFQFMVKDSKKYKDTHGWGYALFQSDGLLYPEDIKQKTASCNACHEIVPERDYVFSELLEVSPFKKPNPANYNNNVSNLTFADLTKKDLAGEIVALMSQRKMKVLKVLNGSMRKNFFGGTLDEITPVLITRLLEHKNQPTAFVSTDGNTFKIIELGNQKCQSGEVAISITERRENWPTETKGANKVRESKLCYKS